jgi:hypothetical protein
VRGRESERGRKGGRDGISIVFSPYRSTSLMGPKEDTLIIIQLIQLVGS